MAEVAYVPVTQEMTEERLREFQGSLDTAAKAHGWDGCFVVMRCRPAAALPPATAERTPL
jgi:hypothetical protein